MIEIFGFSLPQVFLSQAFVSISFVHLHIEDEMEYEQVSDILMQKIEEKYDVEYFEPEQ